MKIIKKTAEELYAIIWCVKNPVPFKQFSSRELNMFRRETLHSRDEEITGF
jgi:hypothetical protein